MNINVKKYRVLLFSTAALVIIICIFAMYYSNANDYNKNKQGADINNDYSYVLKEHNEQIAVYKANEAEPFKLLNVYIYNLPVVDQYELKEGIFVKDLQKLEVIIEDYES